MNPFRERLPSRWPVPTGRYYSSPLGDHVAPRPIATLRRALVANRAAQDVARDDDYALGLLRESFRLRSELWLAERNARAIRSAVARVRPVLRRAA